MATCAVFVSASLSGCIGDSSDTSESSTSNEGYPEPWDRANLEYDNSDVFSRVSIWSAQYFTATVGLRTGSTITAADGGAGITGGAEVHLGLWLPVIEGCDFVPEMFHRIVEYQ